MIDEQGRQLAELAEEIQRCTACPLHKGRTKAVPGEGPANARIMFIGEGPGFHEDQQGRPFVGPSGQLLQELLAEIDMTRDGVFIANIIKCRAPNNRDPQPEEIAACAHFLERQIQIIQPSLIATLGRYSMEKFFPGGRITKIHGKAQKRGRRVYLPLYHPAYVLRNMAAMPDAIRDMRLIPRLLARLDEVLAQEGERGDEAQESGPEAPATPEAPPVQQLSLFD